jgi:3-deoxy-7-phosphoheptulonate synthase
MIIKMRAEATKDEISHIVERIEECGYKAHIIHGTERTIIGAIGNHGHGSELEALCAARGVEEVIPILHPFKLVGRELQKQGTIVEVGKVKIGDGSQVVMAGPCSVESREQLMETAQAVKSAGADMLRGGAYKPRTSPYDFQGLGFEALQFLREASDKTGLPVVTEIMSTDDIDVVAEYADMLQIGARNMQNFALLRRLAKVDKPLLLKRGPWATIREWLLAAEYLLSGGNQQVVLCERGIKSFETETRNTLDLSAIALVKELSHLPVIADPSHGTGRRSLVPAMSKAAFAAGADGLLIEVHPCPERALSDGPQSMDLPGFARLMLDLRKATTFQAAA